MSSLNILELLWNASFIVKLVLLVLFLGSVFSWSIIIFKRKKLKEMKKNNAQFLKIYKQHGHLKEILNLTKNNPYSPCGYVFSKSYEELELLHKKLTEGKGAHALQEHFGKFGMGLVERSLEQNKIQVDETLNDYLSYLASIGSLAPFVGLFGTVWGIVNSFTGIAHTGATLETVAPGIAEALVATAFGLVVAIPAVLFYNNFLSENEKINMQVESFSKDYLNLVEKSFLMNSVGQK
ncbi:MAG: MotA/TolQ/ExbB proton channel family protein [Bacteriovoracaceae bacterium]|nr:MotA/TolQ/ExbB proton channel family protein [Bacteriovoracaceae bacterium]